MSDNFRITEPFATKPPRLKDLINHHVMGDVWVRDTPFGPVTDSLKIAEKFEIDHKNILRAIKKCETELGTQLKFELSKNMIKNSYLGGPRSKQYPRVKYDITEFGLALLLLYINTARARMISAEILYRFFILKTYLANMNQNQIGAIRGHYRKKMNESAIEL